MKKSKTIFGRLSKTSMRKFSWGEKGILFANQGELHVSGFLVRFKKPVVYQDWVDNNKEHENLFIVEDGKGEIILNDKIYPLAQHHTVKVLPGQQPQIRPRGTLSILSVQMPGSRARSKRAGENMNALTVVNPKDIPEQVYEYESLGQEIIIPKAKKSIGLLKFTFPIDKIPLHIHPYSMRLIRTISGKGYTFAEPTLFEMDKDTFTLFSRGTVHTNGPVPGHVYRLWAFQLPWIQSKIDEKHIAGSPKFVKYVGPTPPKKLWKTKPDFLRVIKKFEGKNKNWAV